MSRVRYNKFVNIGALLRIVLYFILYYNLNQSYKIVSRVIVSALQHFKYFHLDAIYIATNAPRMVPLSRELTGVLLMILGYILIQVIELLT